MFKQLFITALLLLAASLLFSQKLNRYNKKGQKTGRWISYSDSARTKKMFDGKLRNGITVGTCYYYTMDGILHKKEVNRFRRLKITFYHSNGKVSQRGMARIEHLTDRIHFYYYGKWKQYDQDGKLIGYEYYKKGELQRTENLMKTGIAKDTFCTILPEIEKIFLSKNKALLDTFALCWNSPPLAEKYRNKIYLADSISFKRIENNLNYYGHPSKEECKDAANIPFFILSHAPVKLREKYVEFFKAAAALGHISKTSLAFYIDKVKIAKGEKQIYGTQFYLDKEKKDVYYPSVDPENLSKRRKEMGLE